MDGPSSPKPVDSSSVRTLHVEAERALSDLITGLRKVFDKLQPGQLGPRDLERLLGMHKSLAWRVLQVAASREPLSAVPHVPGEKGMEKFLYAVSRKGVGVETLRPVREAFTRYRSLAKSHAADRASFDVMLMSVASPQETMVELRAARRAAFRSASYTWGIQTEVRTLTAILTPVGDDAVDLATLRGHYQTRRLRREGFFRLPRTVEHDTDNPDRRRATALPIEPRDVLGGVPLLREFCTDPLPPLQAVELADGNVEYRYVDQPLGDRASVTIFTAEVRRNLLGARYRDQLNSTNAIMMTANVPIGYAVLDLWAPPGFGLEQRSLVVEAIGVEVLKQKPDQWRALPVSTSVECLGTGLRNARIPQVPAQERALTRCFERLGWSPDDYELHRVKMEYPPMGTCLVLQTTLHERPVNLRAANEVG